MKIHYNPRLKQLARDLRNNSTLSEVLLWNELKGRRMYNYQFMRQKPIGNYIVDFYCGKLRLIIEIDGSSHDTDEAFEADSKRQRELEKLGLSFLRFRDEEVKKDIANVLRTIEAYILEWEEQPPGPR